jgi:hypothetical protein
MLKIMQFFKENSSLSSMRGVMITWCMGVLGVWGYLSLDKGALMEIPESVVFLVGILVTGKYLQKGVEVTSSDTCDEQDISELELATKKEK